MMGTIKLTRVLLRMVIQDSDDDSRVFRVVRMSITERFDCIII